MENDVVIRRIWDENFLWRLTPVQRGVILTVAAHNGQKCAYDYLESILGTCWRDLIADAAQASRIIRTDEDADGVVLGIIPSPEERQRARWRERSKHWYTRHRKEKSDGMD